MEVALFIGFCGRGTNPRRVSAGKTPARTPESRLCSWGRDPNGDRTPPTAGPHAATIPASDDTKQRRQQPRQAAQAERRTHQPRHHAQQADPPKLDISPPPPRPSDPPRQQDRPTASHSPTEPGQRMPRTDRPTPSPTPARTPAGTPTPSLLLYIHHRRQSARTTDSGPRWTAGPAAESTPTARRPSTN